MLSSSIVGVVVKSEPICAELAMPTANPDWRCSRAVEGAFSEAFQLDCFVLLATVWRPGRRLVDIPDRGHRGSQKAPQWQGARDGWDSTRDAGGSGHRGTVLADVTLQRHVEVWDRQVFWARLSGQRPRDRPRTCWRDYTFRLAWERPGLPDEELESVACEREARNTLLSLASDKQKKWKWMDGLSYNGGYSILTTVLT